MKKSKATFLLFLCVVSLCVVTAQPVKSQTMGAVYILSDGTIQSSANATVPIQQDGDVYTFTANLDVSAFVVQRSGVTIDGAGFALRGGGDVGIYISVSDVLIENVQLTGIFFDGVHLEGSHNTVTGCNISNNSNGISVYSSNNNITGNSIIGNEIGFNLVNCSSNLFRNNHLDNTHDVSVYGTELAHFINNMDDSNTIGDDKKVYYLVDQENLLITPDTFPDVGYLALVSCNNVTVYGITLTKNVQGILMAYTTSTTIAQCEITDNYVGAMLYASSSNLIGENVIADNNRGIQLSMFSSLNNIVSNTVEDNGGGIFLFNSSQNTIVENNVTNNVNYGIGFSASSYNLIRSNLFDNSIQVYDASYDYVDITPSVNTWFVTTSGGGIGNYWSDYTGIDVKSGLNQNETGSDEIGDTPYVIDLNNEDKYPLMPFGSALAVSIGSPLNQTYTATSVTLTFDVSKTTSWIGYSLDGKANVTISEEATLSGLSYGSHSVTVYATGTGGESAYETVYFTIAEGTDTSQSASFLDWILIIIIVVAVAVIILSLLKIMKKNDAKK
jgi:parallel beta-helix repeat protein